MLQKRLICSNDMAAGVSSVRKTLLTKKQPNDQVLLHEALDKDTSPAQQSELVGLSPSKR